MCTVTLLHYLFIQICSVHYNKSSFHFSRKMCPVRSDTPSLQTTRQCSVHPRLINTEINCHKEYGL